MLPPFLSSAFWSGNSASGYKYKDKKNRSGPCSTATYKDGQLKAQCTTKTCLGYDYNLNEATQATVDAIATVGGTRYCGEFVGATGDDVGQPLDPSGKGKGLFKVKNSPAPAMCGTPTFQCP